MKTRALSSSLRQQLLATVIRMASQIQMEKRESLSSAVNNVWQRRSRSAADDRWDEPCAHEAFWLCAGDYPRALVIYNAPLFSSPLAGRQNLHALLSVVTLKVSCDLYSI